MPELPDVEVYVDCLKPRVVGEPLERARVKSVFLVRSVEPPLQAAHGKRVIGVERLGKRVVLAMEEELFLVFHLMIAGRFRWGASGAGIQGKIGLAAFDFPKGTLLLTEASSRRRASLHVIQGRAELKRHDPGGIDVFAATPGEFHAALTRENHTLKRTLTDPRVLSGIGNAYSDEILHRARLSPVALTSRLSAEESERLLGAARSTLADWTARLRAEVGDGFPEKVTAFREGMAVHGKFGKPCPDCGSPVQRIVYAENETNYCAACQTGGKLLADRVLSRLMKDDWPRTLAEWEEIYSRG